VDYESRGNFSLQIISNGSGCHNSDTTFNNLTHAEIIFTLDKDCSENNTVYVLEVRDQHMPSVLFAVVNFTVVIPSGTSGTIIIDYP
jgi:hypothetical protein